MALYFDFAAHSDVGCVRRKNDDSGYAGRHFAVVADGMGGHVGGDVASASTVLDLVHLDRADVEDPDTILADEIQSANIILNELVAQNPKLSGMGTTVSAILLNDSKLHLAHIGDSRAYRLRNDTWEQITKDHTFVEKLLSEGRITEDEAKVHPHRNVIMRVLGDSDASPELDMAVIPATAGERWMLCSDGVNAVVSEEETEEIVRTASTPREAADRLVERTLELGSPDNVTVVVVDIVDDAESPPSEEFSSTDEPSPDTGQIEVARGGDLAANQALLRYEMANRPHELVGAAQLATESGQIPIVTQRSGERRAAALLQHRSSERKRQLALAALEEEPSKRRFGWVLPTTLVVLILILVTGGYLGYAWTQTQYYVGVHNGKVAMFKGISQDLGPIKMSSVDTESKVPLEALPEYTQTQLKSGIATQSRKDAQQILHDVRITAQQSCPVVAPSPAESGGADGSEGSSGDNATAEHAVPEWCDELRGDIQ
ncbi:BofC C-terminal domain-containing protein [Pseudoglutamicibacter cumminsii]|uniref:PP2C family protein-serine/threonine phosphatase n=1 Tax=Pseudoglutamicibacter cumminsii TaxID=156979 RepID=UPI002ABB4451|nr:BofC C-terminal domain-containing protein [Pseudoglutamicibacter cumminsii]MDZ3744755.1 BofC C-terminal domain-containing protein [Pseudoglutamicibacter cumminsii]